METKEGNLFFYFQKKEQNSGYFRKYIVSQLSTEIYRMGTCVSQWDEVQFRWDEMGRPHP